MVQAGELLTIARPYYTLTTLPHAGNRRSPALPIITELFLIQRCTEAEAQAAALSVMRKTPQLEAPD